MALRNSESGYGALTKFCHWLVVVLFACQYSLATIMLHTPDDGTILGLRQSTGYDWHKSLGLIVLLVMIARLINRQVGSLPPWAATISDVEKIIIHRGEQLLYMLMFVMPVSGLIHVFAGGYGVRLFGVVDLPYPIGRNATVGGFALWVHIVTSKLLLLPLGAHLFLVLGHHFGLRDRLIARMWPASR